MRRDMDLIRDLLLKLEALEVRPSAVLLLGGQDKEVLSEGKTPEEIDYHLSLIYEAGFISAPSFSSLDGRIPFQRLSWQGHEFVDVIRDPAVWKKTKEGATTIGGWTVGIIKDIGVAYLKQYAKDKLHIDL